MKSYAEFLKTKQKSFIAVGPSINAEAINPMLHEWQAAIVVWALRQGRAAIFADCGLGKTFMQLEWARLAA